MMSTRVRRTDDFSEFQSRKNNISLTLGTGSPPNLAVNVEVNVKVFISTVTFTQVE